MAPASSLSRCRVARRSVRLFAGLLGDRAAALGLISRACGVSAPLDSAEFLGSGSAMPSGFSKFSSACTAASHQALQASPKNSLPRFRSPVSILRFLPSTPLARAAALAAVLLAFAGTASAQLYWDNNGGTAGFGTATGTWAAPTTNNSTQGWSTDSTGATLPSGTTTTSTSDALNFGTGSAGLAAGTITVSGNVSANSLTFGSLSGNIVLSSGGNITLGGTTPTITVNNANNTISSVIVGTAGLTKNGTGTLTLSATNTFTGNLVINSGTVATSSTGFLADTANVTINSGGNYTVGAADTINSISGSGALRLNAVLTIGTSTFSGNISGASAIATGGTLTFSGNNTNWSGGISVTNGAVFVAGADNAFGNGTIGGGNLFTVTIRSSDATDRTLANGISRNSGAGGTMVLGSSGTGNLTIQGGYSSTNNFTLSSIQVDNAWTQINGAVTSSSNRYATDALVKTGTGTLILNGNNTYTPNTTISAGTLQIGASGRLGGGNYTSVSAIAINGLTSAFVYSGTNNQILGSVISGNGSLTQNGSGTLSLTNTNTYTGVTTINGGTLSIATITNGGVAGNLGNATNSAGNLVLGGGSLLYTGANASSNRNFTLTASTTSEINVSNATTTLTISGTSASTSGALTKNGSGTLVLSGNNGHSGATSVNGGTLVLSGTNTGSAISINSGGSLLSATSLGSTTVNNGGKIAPGTAAATVGSLTVAGLTLNSGGTFTWDMSNATGAAGTGWDRIVSSGLLTIGSTSGSQFTIAITSSGAPSNWNYLTSGQTWDIITYGSQSGFAANKFAFDTSAFGGSLTADSSWALSDTGSALRLTYTYSASIPTWNGASGNWSSGFTPAITNGADATFAGAGGTATNDILSATLSSVGTMLFSGTGSYTLQANSGSAGFNTASALAVGGPITNTSSGTQTINLALSFAANQTISATSGNITIGGVISGAGALTKQGNNSLTLSGANTYSGGTTLSAGQLNINNATALGNGTFTITSGTLDNTSGSSITLSNNNAQNWNGDFSFTGTNNLDLGTGAVTMNASRTVTANSATLTVGGVVSGTGFGLSKNGSGTLVLGGNNTYSGATTINAGTLEIGSSGRLGGGSYSANIAINGASSTFLYNGTNSQILSGVLSGSGAFTKNNTGDLTISGANGGYNGTFTINAGNVTLSASGLGGVSTGSLGNANVILNNGATLIGNNHNVLNGISSITLNNSTLINTGYYFRTFGGAFTMNNGTLSGSGDFGAGSYTLSGNNTFSGIEISSGTGVFNVTSGTTSLTTTSVVSFFYSGAVLTKNGAGTLSLSANNTYSGGTALNAGTVVIGHANALGTTGNITFVGGALQYGSGITQDLSSRIKNSSSAILVDTNSNNVTFASAVDSTNSGGLTKNGTGTLTLNATNAYTGTTTINTDTLQIGSAGLLGSGNYSGNISNSGSFVFGSNSNQTLSGNISGTGSLTKNGSGVLTLTGTSSFNGATTINSGTLVVNGSAANSSVTIGNATILAGTGTVGGVTVESGGRLSPGNNAVGNLNASTLTFNGGGGYNWEISNVSGTPGTNWDLITVGGGSGAVTINANAGNKFTVYINGNPTGWNTNSSYDWNIIDWGTVTGFDAEAFRVDTTGFTGTAPVGTWAFSNTGGFLNLAYTASDPTWNGTTGNWSTDFTPGLTTGNKSITFAGAAGGTATNDIPSATVGSVAGITFNSTAGAYTLAANSGSAGYDTGSALQLNGNIVNNSTATQTINKALTSTATRVYDAAAGNLTMGGVISGTGGLTKNGSNLLTLSANNTYTGDTTINAGTVQITTTGLLGGGNYSANIVNNGALLLGSNSNQTLSGVISGTGGLTKNGTGTLTLAGNNNYSGNTTINTGTVVIGHANAAGTGRIVQTNGSSVLKIDTTGTITNNMSVYNVLASQSATLSGAITVNNAIWDVETGDTLTISGAVSGNGGVTKNGNGTLILSGSNTYLAPTVVNAGTLEAASTNALGSNNTVQITGGTLLVSVDDALAGKQIELSTNTTGLRFSGTYNGSVGRLTLSANSIIDLGPGSTKLSFHEVFMGIYYLNFYNWTGTTLWGGGTGADTDEVYLGTAGGGNYNLSQVRFYSGTTSDSFLGTGFDLGFDAGFAGDHIIPVPEPETWATGILLVLGGAVWLWRKRRNFTTESTEQG